MGSFFEWLYGPGVGENYGWPEEYPPPDYPGDHVLFGMPARPTGMDGETQCRATHEWVDGMPMACPLCKAAV